MQQYMLLSLISIVLFNVFLLTPANGQPRKFESLEAVLKANNHLPVAERIALYHRLKKEEPSRYNFKTDKELNQYGYSLLFANKLEEALAIFKLVVAEFPAVANAYDSLGEAHLRLGDEKLALQNYKKSLALNPENKNAAYQINYLQGNFDVLVSEESWGKEIFVFPISFAKELAYEGVEDARFPKNWAKKDSSAFWSYVIGWRIQSGQSLTAKELERDWQNYFDGLMNVVNKDSTLVVPKSNVRFMQTEHTEEHSSFVGKVSLYDAFVTKAILRLQVKAEQFYCPEQKRAVLIFRFSPQAFTHDIWLELEKLRLRAPHCTHGLLKQE